jgi:aryl sulfotransferase
MSGIYWIASYPKSGNTWVRMVLRSLEQGGAPVRFDDDNAPWWDPSHRSRIGGISSSRFFFEDVLDIESSDLTEDEIETLRSAAILAWAESAGKPPIVKTHDAWLSSRGTPLFPPESTKGAVVIVRDPRDVAVSFANHSGISIDAAIARMADHDCRLARTSKKMGSQLTQWLPTWSGHVAGWLDAPVRRLLMRYEDMKADTPGILAKVAAFFEIDATAETVKKAVDAARFDRLQAEEARTGFRERPAVSSRFFRRGVAGGWRDTLSREQVERIEADHGAMMRRLGYEMTT